MDSKQRYKELIKENNQAISYLNDSYQNIANIFAKKARGYGIKGLDTEVKIKEVIKEISSYNDKGIETNIAIPNITLYIEDKMKSISKAPSNKDRIKEIIAVSIFLLVIAGYFVVNFMINKKLPLDPPADITASLMTNSSTNQEYFYLEWKYNNLATEGYNLKVIIDGETVKDIVVEKNVDTTTNRQCVLLKDVIYDSNKTYVFEISTVKTDTYEESDVTIYTYDK